MNFPLNLLNKAGFSIIHLNRRNIWYYITLKSFIHFFKEDEVWLAYNIPLDVYGYGYTIEEARNSFYVCLEEFFDYSYKKNILEKNLKDCYWKKIKNNYFHFNISNLNNYEFLESIDKEISVSKKLTKTYVSPTHS